ncbi:MAG: gamma-glutamyltransferase [Woeseiaceae bacterium]|nr:gamma-glutamyltransferase [Woeseiaceae bacterium]
MARVATATSSQLAAQAAGDIARAGGNAVDCALAAALVTMNTEPGVCALAGGAYVTVWPADGEPVTIDGNVAVPGRDTGGSRHAVEPVVMDYGGGIETLAGAASIAVPGTLAALERASQRYGRMPWRTLLEPSIASARDGFPLSSACHYYLQYSGEVIFGRSADGYHALHDAGGRLRAAGATVCVPHLADSLELVAAEGARAFYEGELAAAIANHVQDAGGLLSRADLAAYRALDRRPLEVRLDGWRIATNPPPAVGGTVLAAMLGAFRDHPARRWDRAAVARLVRVQRAVLGFRRERLDLAADPYAASDELLALVAGNRLPGAWESASTVHTSAVDDAGNAAAITASAGYGSGEMPAGTGLWLNNCLGELELNRRGLDAGPPGARLPSNMTPGAARDGERVLAFGSPGADRITTAIHQFLVNFLQQGRDLDAAIAAPRLHVEIDGREGRLAVEPGIDLPELDLPVSRYTAINMYFGGVAAASYAPGDGLAAAADPRRAGGVSIAGG